MYSSGRQRVPRLSLNWPELRITLQTKTPLRLEEQLDRLHLIKVFVALVAATRFYKHCIS